MTDNRLNRRTFLKLAGMGGVVFASGLSGVSRTAWAAGKAGGGTLEDFYFVQLSDTHWGFEGPAVNPDPKGTLPKAVSLVNQLAPAPDFIIFTGDLTQTTDDPAERAARMQQFKSIVGKLKAKNVKFMPGEHDASLDNGEVYKKHFGETHYSFDHKGIHFIAIDNVSDPGAAIGDAQLQWLADDLAKQDKDAAIVVFAHRPLFDLYPQWDWATRDGQKAIDLLMPYKHVTVFYGHIHQENHHMTGHIAHHSARSLMFPLPPAGSQPKRAPIPWDAAEPYKGLGFRQTEAQGKPDAFDIAEFDIKAS